MGNLKPVLAGDATTTMMTMTTILLIPVVAVEGEGLPIHPMELAQTPGQPSPRGTSKTLN